MDCPNCRLVNPKTAMRCDCGYDFEPSEIAQPYLRTTKTNKSSSKSEIKGRLVLAATVNAAIAILLLPSAHVGLSTGIRLADVLGRDVFASSPMAVLVFWRTLVHARRFHRERVVGLQPLIEAAVTGLFVAVLFVYPALLITWRVYPILAAGAGIGLFLGVIFRSIVLLCLRGAA